MTGFDQADGVARRGAPYPYPSPLPPAIREAHTAALRDAERRALRACLVALVPGTAVAVALYSAGVVSVEDGRGAGGLIGLLIALPALLVSLLTRGRARRHQAVIDAYPPSETREAIESHRGLVETHVQLAKKWLVAFMAVAFAAMVPLVIWVGLISESPIWPVLTWAGGVGTLVCMVPYVRHVHVAERHRRELRALGVEPHPGVR